MKFTMLIIFLLIASSVSAKRLTVSSLNIHVYGKGGMYTGTPDDEFRDKWIREFIDLKLKDSDVITFQEILQKEKFIKNVMGKKMNCVSYEAETKAHMYVVLCFKKKYKFIKEAGEDSYAFRDIALNYYRPAVYGVLTERGKKLAHIVSVHLKAHPKGHDTRTKQIKILSDRIKKMKDGLPVIITGDYNTYDTEEVNDYAMIDSFMNPINIFQADRERLLTYKTPFYIGSYDHFWISEYLVPGSHFRVDGPCNLEEDGRRFDDMFFYNQFVSDHCPISLTVNL